MLTIDESRWPLVVMTAAGAIQPDDTQAYLGALARFLMLDEAFAVVLDFTGLLTEEEGDKQRANKHMNWINAHREQMRSLCREVVYLMAPGTDLDLTREQMDKAWERTWGCPVKASVSLAESLELAATALKQKASERKEA